MADVQIDHRADLISPRSCLEAMLTYNISGVPLLDIGTTSLTGLRANALPNLFDNETLTNPIFQTIALDREDCLRLRSDFIRTGVVYDPRIVKTGRFKDAFGVEWLNSDGYFAPSNHPLESAGLSDIEHYGKPDWKLALQYVKQEFGDSLVIADAPCPGLLDSCFLLRNAWQFMSDISEKRTIAGTLLEWLVETISSAYEYMLGSLDRQPDLLIYSDDLGFQNSMFLSPSDFRTYLLPWLSALVSRLRKLTPAAICFHSCGAISPILKDIANLGFEILNLDPYAKGMDIKTLRKVLPKSVILHGVNDLCALGEVVARQDRAGIAYFSTELAQSLPVIAAPVDSLSCEEEVMAAIRGAAFIKNLSAEGFDNLRRLGPVRSVIEEALEKTLSEELVFI
ncbi:uroporphyrinogen decarboxylase family protein [Desulfosporosinus sp. PR]|uniref:uroporphyrinogen decarboxylase family protein n=1 Tax=Candidatus Desulfosporosinus nitrosoreducens TaxID=3401928 RepID=UPI0027E9C4AB|nr:uroporphyrinogen decarboxylase family protein [Desulfosporosinus sp. PR]MDQ7097105.1 uroporphyrinogen decarboxylase family protein [Desulfosporosinus sp. PR]